jgi:CRISPR-associated protein Cas1
MPEAFDDDGLMPVRMVNEAVYCPRLFWLEHVAGHFAENHHVVEGQAAHGRVDRSATAARSPDDLGPWKARSVSLSSVRLGVSAKLDLVEADDGSVMPVDTKKGSPPGEGLWPSDEVQLVLQALLLRERGYRVDAIAAYYAAERRRVVVPLTDELESRALEAVRVARELETADAAPPPLVDSPKCPGCSLNAICQPDEVTAIRRGEEHDEQRPLRRVVPAQDDAKPLVIVSSSVRLGVKKDALTILDRNDDETEVKEVGLGRVASLSVYGQASVSTAALHACFRHGVPVSFFTTGGYFLGRASSNDLRAADARRAQVHHGAGTERGLAVARVLVADKIANARTLLRRNGDADDAGLVRLQRLCVEAAAADSAQSLLAIEGEAAKKGWSLYSALVARDDETFAMKGRTRRPPEDPTNAMISFLAGMLVRDCTQAVINAGMDPLFGVYHTTHHGRPSLALDLMEPFRPLIVESVVLGVVRRGEVTASSFFHTGQAVVLQPAARRVLVDAYERRVAELCTHPLFGYRVSYRQVFTIQARLLARVLTGELAAMPSFRTR